MNVGLYGTQPISGSDGELADKAFERLGQKMDPGVEPAATYPKESTPPPKAMTDSEMADLGFKHLGK